MSATARFRTACRLPKSPLLMHGGEVIAIRQPGIDRLAREGLALPGMAHVETFQHILHLFDHVGVIEKVTAFLQDNLIDETRQGRQVFKPVVRNPSVAPREKIGYPSAILRRTGGVALDAVGIGSTRLQRQFGFKPDFVFPGDVEVVFVDETRAPMKLKLAKRNIRRPATELPGTKIGGAQVEQK